MSEQPEPRPIAVGDKVRLPHYATWAMPLGAIVRRIEDVPNVYGPQPTAFVYDELIDVEIDIPVCDLRHWEER